MKKLFWGLLSALIMIIGMLPMPTNAAITTKCNGYTLTADGYNKIASNTVKELRILGFEIREDSSICINARIIFRQYGSAKDDITFSPDTNCLLEYKAVGKKSFYDNVTITLYRSAKDHADDNNDYICDFCGQNSFINFKIATFDKTTNTANIWIPTAGTYTVIFADYGENNALLNVEIKTITTKGAEIVPVSITKGFTLGVGDNIMLWNNMTELVPCCKAFVIE